ncbi:Relaxase/Mobilisation nuclease domain-containing protein [Flavobacterium flevense]|uniref:Mobilization protein n=1 Tax=Flavobacterium flevense TaxID=983 RepID=A0A4Y4B0E9_9FLAO|nr:conjugal transfer protein MobB [Flavobacterium flevense]GEC73826.1 mobilization protein [Flavobacterium flevense]SHM20027.1 Relaxase/Mobilisation nuclease domain-containing protein [Flavobacterium flevense]
MIAKIGRGTNIIGALSYNQLKVDQENGAILATHRIRETIDGKHTVPQLHQSFEPYLIANKRTEKPVLHISINPDPRDNVSDEDFKQIAKDYMERMGYGDQPYVVFKHTDIERAHIHIVSTCVDRNGKKLADNFEKMRSMDACRALEQEYKLIPATEKSRNPKEELFRPIDYRAANVKSQIASVVRHLPKYYHYQNLGAYNALLSLFNITTEEVKGELHGQPKQGLVYFALNEQGEKASNPFKASLFGKQTGLDSLQKHFEQSKDRMKTEPAKEILKKTIEVAIHTTSNEPEFKKQLLEQGINTVVRRNHEGRIYGITFIDHESRSVWNGSQLGKNLSANIFNDCWNEKTTQKRQDGIHDNIKITFPESTNNTKPETEKPHALFDFLDKNQSTQTNLGLDFIESFSGLLPEAQAEDYEEQLFANKMKKKKKSRRPGNKK